MQSKLNAYNCRADCILCWPKREKCAIDEFHLPPSLLLLYCLFIQIANGQNNFYHFICSQIKIEIFNFLNVNVADWQLCAIRPKKTMVLSRCTIKMNFNIAWQKLIAMDCRQKKMSTTTATEATTTTTTTVLPHNLCCS